MTDVLDVSFCPRDVLGYNIEKLLNNRFCYGHRTGATNPKMRKNLLTYFLSPVKETKKPIAIIDMNKTLKSLDNTLKYIYQVGHDKKILFVTNKSVSGKNSNIFVNAATESGSNYVERWRSGVLTNWRNTTKSLASIKRYEKNMKIISENTKDGKNYDDYKSILQNKKKIRDDVREYDKLKEMFCGIINMNGLPDIMIIDNVHNNQQALKEANSLGIPVIALVDSNIDPTNIDFPVPGNDDSDCSLRFFANLLSATILLSKNKNNNKTNEKNKDEENLTTSNVN